ncbi:hypothetical protein H9P43_004954 [Blastocladiella emersonii ATCC 22665]|nr:hypothetical protein H9P43_004954 [Blastocladiella emersonii ATCC 22665]
MTTPTGETNHLAALSSIPGAGDALAAAANGEPVTDEMRAIMQAAIESDPGLQKSLLEAMQREHVEREKSEITPLRGYVVKTALTKSTESYPSGLKVFVNMTHSPYVPAPPVATEDEIKRALKGEATTEDGKPTWRVPMSLSGLRDDSDKAGRACLVVDALVHSDVHERGEADWDFKVFLIELALEWVEEKHKLSLSRDFSLPKMKSKGAVAPHTIYRPQRAGIATATKQRPTYTLRRDAARRHVVVSVALPLVYTAEKIDVDIEPARVDIDHPLYALSVPLDPLVDVDAEKCDAVFDKATRTLAVTLPYLAGSA